MTDKEKSEIINNIELILNRYGNPAAYGISSIEAIIDVCKELYYIYIINGKRLQNQVENIMIKHQLTK